MIKGATIPETSRSDEEIIEELNNQIAKLRLYGLRKVKVTEPSYMLNWSNAGKCWYVMYGYGVFQPGEEVQVDANQFLGSYRRKVLDRVVPKLDYLPLYKMSTEAKLRGEYGTD